LARGSGPNDERNRKRTWNQLTIWGRFKKVTDLRGRGTESHERDQARAEGEPGATSEVVSKRKMTRGKTRGLTEHGEEEEKGLRRKRVYESKKA